MKRYIVVSTLVALLAIHAAVAFGAVTVQIKSGKEIRLYKDYHALVVGIGDYDHWPDLRGSVRDAKEVGEALKTMGMSVTTLLDPTAARLKTALNELTYGPGREKDRAVLFFYSGHGETETLATGQKLGYIVPKDAPLPARDPAGFADRAISMNQIETYALRIKSKHVLMVFDSCFSGSVFSSLKGAPTDISEKSVRAVRQFITAGNDEEQVPDESVFKTCFLQGIRGDADANKDGYVTASELGMHLDSSVVNYTKGSQHPQYGKIRDPELDKGDFIFVASSGTIVDEPQKSPSTEKGTLRVTADVSGARVYIDGSDRGGAPAALNLDPKTYRVEVRKQGFDVWRTQVSVETGRSASLAAYLTPEKPRMARLFVDATPPDATIRILNIGPRYERGMELDPGSYILEVSAEDCETEQRRVELAAGEDAYESFRLKKIERRVGGKTFTNTLGMTFVPIPPGTFMMGSPSNESGRDNDETQHRVTITKPFYVQTTEVTVGQWRRFIRDSGYRTDAETGGGAYVWTGSKWEKKEGSYWDNPGFFQSDEHPATCVSWTDCQAFIEWLNRKDGKIRYRLPTEAEWEYAARGGSESKDYKYSGGNDVGGVAWYNDNAGGKTHPVGTKQPNELDIYDMSGNVWEWCQDWYGYYPSGSAMDPAGSSGGSHRVDRGGSWDFYARHCRSADRNGNVPGRRGNNLGFRLAGRLE